MQHWFLFQFGMFQPFLPFFCHNFKFYHFTLGDVDMLCFWSEQRKPHLKSKIKNRADINWICKRTLQSKSISSSMCCSTWDCIWKLFIHLSQPETVANATVDLLSEHMKLLQEPENRFRTHLNFTFLKNMRLYLSIWGCLLTKIKHRGSLFCPANIWSTVCLIEIGGIACYVALLWNSMPKVADSTPFSDFPIILWRSN